MAEAVYALCALTSFICAALLWRSFRHTGVRLLLWSSICFIGLTLNNIVLFADQIIFLHTDLSVWRLTPAAIGLSILVYGLIWDAT